MGKLWTSAAIRNLARKRLKEAEEAELPAALRPKPESETPAPAKKARSAREADPRLKMAYNPNESKLEWMWGRFERAHGNRVLLAVPGDDPDGGEEMVLLCETLGLDVVDIVFYHVREKPSAATYLGSGSLEEMHVRMRKLGAAALVMDAPLSPSQLVNVEEIVKSAVVDRQGVILAIFELHAKTRLAKMQVELARLKYLQPRLAGIWMGLSRQSGGGGVKGRGQGETRLELDRRVVKNRISALTKKLKEAERVYATQSARRHELARVALVGYTNAGKSTLMRRLTKTDAEVEDKLFSTLDTTVRPLAPPTEPKILVSDTVGFVRDLPPDLVASFKSTLREALDSQLILHVLDISHPRWKDHIRTTDEVLEEIGAKDIRKILVLNKVDLVGESLRLRLSEVNRFLAARPGYLAKVPVSALTEEGLGSLRVELMRAFEARDAEWLRENAEG